MIKFYIIVFSCLISLTSSVFSQSRRDIEKQMERTRKEIELTNKLIQETENSKQQIFSKLEFLTKKIDLRKTYISNLSTEISYLTNKSLLLNEKINSLKSEVVVIKKEYAQIVYYTYKNRSSYDRLMFILSSSDFNQAYSRLKYLQYYTEYRKNQANEIIRKTRELNKIVISFNNTIAQKKNAIIAKQSETELLSQEKDQQSSIATQLESKQRELKSDLQAKQIIAEKLKHEIERIIAEEQRKLAEKRRAEALAAAKKAKTTNKPVEKSQDMILGGKFGDNIGKLPWPLAKCVVTQTFGEHPHPLVPTIKTINNGIDISTTKGSLVHSIFDGEVTKIIVLPGANTAVLVRHGNYISVYSNLVDVVVSTGQKIKLRQVIGTVFTDVETGKTTMNFQIWKETTKLDPQKCLSK